MPVIAARAEDGLVQSLHGDLLIDLNSGVAVTTVGSSAPRVGGVRGSGAMVAAELVEPGADVPDQTLAKAVATPAHQRGVIVLTCGTYGNVLRFLPPLTITDGQLHEAFDVLDEVFAATPGGTRSA